MDEHEIPEGWADATIGDLVRVGRERIDPQTHPDFPYIGLEDVDPHSLGLSRIGRAGDMRSTSVHFRPGDVLYGRLRPYLNKVVSPDFEGLCSAEFIPLVPADGVLARFLKLRMNCEDFVAFASHLNEGDRPRVDFEQVAGFTLALPPTAEQHRILAKLDEVLSRVSASRDRLARVPGILKRFRQAVLAAACSGRLTEDWRTRVAQSPVATDMEEGGELPDIPVSWSWRRLPELGELGRGRSRHRPRDAKHLYGGKYPFIQTGDVARSGGRIETYQQTYSEAGLEQSRLWPAGTVCITIAANIANSGILTFSACFPDSVVGFVANTTSCRGAFVEYFIRTARASLAEFAPATAQKNINLETLSNLMVPCPSVVEQEEIVRRVDALFALADLVERRAAAAASRADRLTQAVLAKAFRGELVPTEAELARQEGRPFESAEGLLARIRETPIEARPKRTHRGRRRSHPT